MKTIDVLLEDLQWPLERLAEKCELPLDRARAILDGRWLPSPQERGKIAAALNVGVDQISWGHTMSPRNVRYHRFGLKEDFN